MNIKKVKDMDYNGLILCDIQAKTFELSNRVLKTSSAVFIRRFMNSEIIQLFDNTGILNTTYQPIDFINEMNQEYGVSTYGSEKYDAEVLYWIGYFYRYLCFTYDISSKRAYKFIKPSELKKVYLGYHSLSMEQAIERVLDGKGLLLSEAEEFERQKNIVKKYYIHKC